MYFKKYLYTKYNFSFKILRPSGRYVFLSECPHAFWEKIKNKYVLGLFLYLLSLKIVHSQILGPLAQPRKVSQ